VPATLEVLLSALLLLFGCSRSLVVLGRLWLVGRSVLRCAVVLVGWCLGRRWSAVMVGIGHRHGRAQVGHKPTVLPLAGTDRTLPPPVAASSYEWPDFDGGNVEQKVRGP